MSAPSKLPPLHVIEPTSDHTHTIIALHGRGSQGPEFAEDFLEGRTSAGKSVQEHLPSYRWVFPSSQERHSTVFQEVMDEWFDIYSLTDPSAREELQVEGLRESVGFLLKTIHDEIELLNGDATRLFIMGISQGYATGLIAMLAGQVKLGGFIGLSGWMPFRAQIEEIEKKGLDNSVMREEELSNFFRATFGLGDSKPDVSAQSVLSTPVLLCHAVDDEVVDIELNRQACAVLEILGMRVQWKEYQDGGHWLNEPQGYDDMLFFLAG